MHNSRFSHARRGFASCGREPAPLGGEVPPQGSSAMLFVVCSALSTFPWCWGAGSGCFPGNPAPEVLSEVTEATACLPWLFLNIPTLIKSSLHQPPLGNSCSSTFSQGYQQGLWGLWGTSRVGEPPPSQPQNPQGGKQKGSRCLKEGNIEQEGCFPQRPVQPGDFPALLRQQKSRGK